MNCDTCGRVVLFYDSKKEGQCRACRGLPGYAFAGPFQPSGKEEVERRGGA